ncbi:MAG: 30S ribosomal protein S17 [Candidatus Diapherotrites archaeon]|nr:30S ribosomal protein S17 [Candidatus Diapherotrites archaeon]
MTTECKDTKCAVHGSLKVRGNVFTVKVVNAKASKTVTVERDLIEFIPKYERYLKKRSRMHAHNPDCIAAKEGDIVRIGETRRLSRTKGFAIIEKIGEQKK